MSTRSLNSKLLLSTAALIVGGWLGSGPALAQDKVLRAVMHADVRTLDPFWTTQTIAGIHGLMVYDTLFSSDINLDPKPQMVDTWTASDDKLTWTFTLRDGLKFHDGAPVKSADCIASIQRWAKRDVFGQKLADMTLELGKGTPR